MNLPNRRVPNQTSVFVLFLPIFGLSVFPCVFLCSCVFVFLFLSLFLYKKKTRFHHFSFLVFDVLCFICFLKSFV